ncbi:MAG: hypothetical protein LBQ05_01075 [Christensenellaceae bacterium]|jgi:hypothetical protein|nr:hypothetical protein [Christensenellaceae bacterium]
MSKLGKKYAQQQAIAKRKQIITIICVSVAVLVLSVSLVIWGGGNNGGIAATLDGGIQRIATQSNSSGSKSITVESGKEVVWTINAGSSLGCMKGFKANSALGISQTELTAGGSKTVRFTPSTKGTYTLRCLSMGMTYCKVIVK